MGLLRLFQQLRLVLLCQLTVFVGVSLIEKQRGDAPPLRLRRSRAGGECDRVVLGGFWPKTQSRKQLGSLNTRQVVAGLDFNRGVKIASGFFPLS